jgi:hypothetical protein
MKGSNGTRQLNSVSPFGPRGLAGSARNESLCECSAKLIWV